MAEIIKMPKMSDTMEEGVIASWLKKVGDKVESGDIIAEVETDKATMELESYEDGTLLHIGVQENESVPVDGVIAVIGEEGENIDDLLKDIEQGGGASEKSEKEDAKEEASEDDEETTAASEGEEEEAVDASDVNATVVTMPKMSDTMEEGVIASWLKKVGDKVESGDIIAEVETDKATMELESYEDGTLLYIGVDEGGSVPIDGVIAVIGEEGADYEKLLKAQSSKSNGKAEKKTEEKKPDESKTSGNGAEEKDAPEYTPSRSEGSDSVSRNGRVKASPLAKKMAQEMGYDIAEIPGSGESGRIVKRDVEQYKPQAKPTAQPEKKEASAPQAVELPKVVGEESYEEVRVSQMRKTIGKRLSESKFTAPHFYLTMEINMDKAIEARQSMNEISPVKISFNDIVVKAVGAALRQHPDVNVSWLGDKIRKNHHIHIGIAVAVDEGLLVPVVRFADNKSLSHIAAEVKDLAGKAKDKKLQPKDWEGSTFTISNLGMFGIEEFTAIINPPDACILAVGGIKQTAVVKDGQLVPGNVMKVTMSCDHRAVDGAVGAAFLKTLKSYLEDPIRIMI
ncbi:MAG: pyruvate dehydrogenase complex dihydrolipoamide acetyltransferase [Cyclobacteriaceae bacterium]